MFEHLYRVSGKKASLLIELLVGTFNSIQFNYKRYFFSRNPALSVVVRIFKDFFAQFQKFISKPASIDHFVNEKKASW